jgi:hypothetical protein
MPLRPLSRRTLLRGAGVCVALPFLEAMLPKRAHAQDEVKRFIAFFYPNGTDPRRWNPPAGLLNAQTLPECLQDLAGFGAEGDYPAGSSLVDDVTIVTGTDHSGVAPEIHQPSMALSAHKGVANNYTPPETLDQYLADRIAGDTPFRHLAFSATGSTDVTQGHISFGAGGQTTPIRNPGQAFDTLFGSLDTGGDSSVAEAARLRQASVLDAIREDAERLHLKLGAADKLRVAQYTTAVRELEQQVTAIPADSCSVPAQPGVGGNANWHVKMKAFIDLTAVAMACDLTRVATLQYSDSWGVHYGDYPMGTGLETLGDWSDHFISHKLDDTDRATDLDNLDRAQAQQIADARVVLTSRFKVRRFAYLVESLKKLTTPTGTLLDESMVMLISENGDGDSHSRKNMPVILAGHAGGFQTGRVIAADGAVTGSLHGGILNRLGFPVTSYGDPAGPPLTDI